MESFQNPIFFYMKDHESSNCHNSKSFCHPGLFFPRPFQERGGFCAKTHCSFRWFPPERFSLWLSSKAWRWGDPKWKPAAAPFPLKDGCNGLNMLEYVRHRSFHMRYSTWTHNSMIFDLYSVVNPITSRITQKPTARPRGPE